MSALLDRRVTEADPDVVLGVRDSFSGRLWVPRLDPARRPVALAMAQRHGLSSLVADIMAARGVGLDEVGAYLTPNLRTMLPEPYTLTDMEKAAERLAQAIEAGEHVAIFGDYDVDGATSSAVLASLLRAAGTPYTIYIPDRIFEGYGPNAEAIARLAEGGARLLVTVDCGTTSHSALDEARALGLDVVVLDHHGTGATLPEVVALVNPQRQDDLSGQQHMAAVGVVFLTIIAVSRLLRQRAFWSATRPEPDLLALLDLVGLGTAADVVPLKGVNRAFVAKGLAALGQRRRPGLRALADLAGMRGQPSPYHLGFLLGPRINAGGRIGRADLGARLLMCDDEVEARVIAEELDNLNRERQAIEQAVLAEAMEQADSAPAGSVTIVAGQGWHPGIVGLVAARLAERCQRPAFAIALDADGKGTGSGRSLPGVDLGAAVRKAVDRGLLVKGGGHAAAAGITIATGGLDAFSAFMDSELEESVAASRGSALLKIDGLVSAGGLQSGLCEDLAKAGPYGAGNPEPVLALPRHTLTSAEPVGTAHLRLRLKADDGTGAEAIAFRALGRPLGESLLASRGRRLHIAGGVQQDEWGGRCRVSLRVIDAAVAED
ncbi:single-stranded-DNA-specific exonuclease RecJ [Terrihabitans sp. B22-R8]|uniref:single-stranded-DNA-specific exonuclease RecJ n=1 Tax=Terrihabitans sp. B22-R8 TaxID=3425128 RepID=UPI00403CFBCC